MKRRTFLLGALAAAVAPSLPKLKASARFEAKPVQFKGIEVVPHPFVREGDIFNISPTTYEMWSQNRYVDPGPLDKEHIREELERVLERSAKEPARFYVNPSEWEMIVRSGVYS